MWIMGREGFISVVEKPADREFGRLTLRARVRADLDALRSTVLPTLSAIEVHTGTDYPYRATAARAAVARAMARWVDRIDYDNFKDSVAKTQGKARAAVYARVWEALLRLEVLPKTDRTLPGITQTPKADAYGGVLIDAAGRVLLREPTQHFGGYVWTFAKGRPDRGESPAEAALREVREETGFTAEITDLLPGVFAGTTTTTAMFLMTPIAQNQLPCEETAAIGWFEPTEAEQRLALTQSRVGRERDLAILRAALEVWRAKRERRGS